MARLVDKRNFKDPWLAMIHSVLIFVKDCRYAIELDDEFPEAEMLNRWIANPEYRVKKLYEIRKRYVEASDKGDDLTKVQTQILEEFSKFMRLSFYQEEDPNLVVALISPEDLQKFTEAKKLGLLDDTQEDEARNYGDFDADYEEWRNTDGT